MSEKVFRLLDTMTRESKPVTCLEAGHLKLYSCGPTVYSYAHIGNFRTFLTSDLITRVAEAIGWRVTSVANITDVGHMTQDDVADATGEDKMAKALSSKDGERFNNVWELAAYYEDAFREDWARLNLREPTVRPKATQHMREQIVAAEQLIKQGNAYETPTGVYFSIDSFPSYGKLSGNTRDNLLEGVREVVQDDNKRQQADFALWKKDDKHLMQWYSPFGWGFPGWHLECSVMAMAYLGETIDLHAGGEDLIFPHHECEIAQSEALTGKPFCNHWVHTRFLQVNGNKMSKSLGNFYTVRDLFERGADAFAIRYALIGGMYSKQYNFTDQALSDATGNVERLRRADAAAKAGVEAARPGEDTLGTALDAIYEEALDAMLNDLNTPIALAKALEGARVITREADTLTGASAASGQRFIDRINALLGIVKYDRELPCGEGDAKPKASGMDEAWVEEKIAERTQSKAAKDFARADAIRSELAEKGIELRDTPNGVEWVAKRM